MIHELDEAGVGRLRNEAFKRYASQYVSITRCFWDAIAEYGLPVSQDEPLDLSGSEASRLAARGVRVCNDAKSFHVNWLSPACEA